MVSLVFADLVLEVDLALLVQVEELALVVVAGVAVVRSPLTECGYTQSNPVDE